MLVVPVVVQAHFLHGDLAPRPQVVESRVAGDAEDPRRERDLTRLVLQDCPRKLREDVLGDVLGLVGVLDDAADVAEYIVGEAHIEEMDSPHVAGLGARDGLRDQLWGCFPLGSSDEMRHELTPIPGAVRLGAASWGGTGGIGFDPMRTCSILAPGSRP